MRVVVLTREAFAPASNQANRNALETSFRELLDTVNARVEAPSISLNCSPLNGLSPHDEAKENTLGKIL